MNEIWKPYKYKGELTKYDVSTEGRVRNRISGVILKPGSDAQGYKLVSIYVDAVPHSIRVHRLVAETFIPNPSNKPEVNHKDGNRSNNCLDNLEWCTAQENTDDFIEKRVMTNIKKVVDEEAAAYTDEQIVTMYRLLKCGFDFGSIEYATGIDRSIISSVAYGKLWNALSEKHGFDYEEYTKHNRKRGKGANFYKKYYKDLDALIITGKSSNEIMRLYPIPNTTPDAYATMINRRRRALIADGVMKPLDMSAFRSNLTADTVHAICEDILKGDSTMQEIAMKYNTNLTTIFNIKSKRIWRDITTQYDFAKPQKQLDWSKYYDWIANKLRKGNRKVDIARELTNESPDLINKAYGIITFIDGKIKRGEM